MQNRDTSEIDRKLGTDIFTVSNDIQTTMDETLKVRLNKDHIIMVNKEKLLEKSHYFKSITNPCFADHKSEFTEVTFSVSFELFKMVIDYVITDIINICSDTVLEILEISEYLQIDSLIKVCLDHFIYNLNIKTLDHQLSLVEKFPKLCNDFKKVALKFKESGRPSVKGMYTLEYDVPPRTRLKQKYSLRFITDEHDYVLEVKSFENKDSLHYCSNTIVMQGLSPDRNVLLIQYDLITGNLVEIELENHIHSTICSDSKNLFVISKIKEDKIENFSLSLLSQNNDDEVLKVFKTKTFSIKNSEKPYSDNWFDGTFIFFTICDDGKLYFVYRLYSKLYSGENLYNFLHDMHLVTICVETMTIVSNRRLTECTMFGTGGVMTRKESIRRKKSHRILEKLFYLRKSNRCYINIHTFGDIILVFDVKNQYFYFSEDMIPISHKHSDDIDTHRIPYNRSYYVNSDDIDVKYTVDKDDVVYMYIRYGSGVEREIRTFQYCNDKLVDAGIKWKVCRDDIHTKVDSICIV